MAADMIISPEGAIKRCTTQSQAFTTTDAVFWILISLCSAIPLWYIDSYIKSPLRRYPGPLLAAWSNYWRMYYAAGGSMHLKIMALHEEYGPIVRIAPNQIDVDCPTLLKTCFDHQGKFRKTEFYSVSGVKQNGKITYNIFSETNSEIHAQMKRPIAKYYSMTSVLGLQSHIDDVISHFACQLDKRFATTGSEFGEFFDFGQWLLYLTWDLVGQVTYSRRFGYLDHGFDFDGTLSASEKAMSYLSIVGMQPVLDRYLDKNQLFRIGPPGFNALVTISLAYLTSRSNGAYKHNPEKPDFLDRFLEAKECFPMVVNDEQIISYLLINMAAGADTTAITLRSIFYLSLKHPSVWARLEKEVLAADFAQKSTLNIPPSFQQARAIPYLEAVTREALRLYPGNCFSMERYVPPGGLQLPDGSSVPEGTAVGFNAYVMNRNKDIWGQEAECFVPERWLRDGAHESEADYKKRLSAMNSYDLSFGGGNRKCIGMHLGLMEVYKVAATLICLYEFQMSSESWNIHCSFFPRQSNFRLKIKKRQGMSKHI